MTNFVIALAAVTDPDSDPKARVSIKPPAAAYVLTSHVHRRGSGPLPKY